MTKYKSGQNRKNYDGWEKKTSKSRISLEKNGIKSMHF